MNVDDGFVNRVANSGIVTLDLADFKPEGERKDFDMKQVLFMGLILKEKDFREFIASHDWTFYNQCHVAVWCSTDAIIPTWAYMLLAHAMHPFAKSIHFCAPMQMEERLWKEGIQKLDDSQWKNARVVIKGCGEESIPVSAYIEITRKLTPVVKSVMYGEPCSTVPIFKNKPLIS